MTCILYKGGGLISLPEYQKHLLPDELYFKGNLDVLKSAGMLVSIIGSRNANDDEIMYSRKIAHRVSRAGGVVVSGLARGIDTGAHEAAMDAGGWTIAVLGTPTDTCYPYKNSELQKKIASKHLVLSQFKPESAIRRSNFPIRSRLMALISKITIVIAAQDKSGSTNQMWEALRLGRKVYISCACINNKDIEWPMVALERGAVPMTEKFLEILYREIRSSV